MECATDPQEWQTCRRGSSTALSLRAMLDDPLTGALMVPIAAHHVRYLRLRQTGVDAPHGWTVAELTVFGPPA